MEDGGEGGEERSDSSRLMSSSARASDGEPMVPGASCKSSDSIDCNVDRDDDRDGDSSGEMVG
jgi:hypothetical protein